MNDKELRGCGIIIIGARHRNNTALVAEGIVYTVCGKFALNFFIRATCSVSFRVAALNHKVFNNTVEGKAVIESLANQLLEVCYRKGSVLRIKLNDDITVVALTVISGVGNVELYIIGSCFGCRISVCVCKMILNGSIGRVC